MVELVARLMPFPVPKVDIVTDQPGILDNFATESAKYELPMW